MIGSISCSNCLIQRMESIQGKMFLFVCFKCYMLLVNSTSQRCPNKIIKTFMIEDFFHLPSVSTTPVVHLELPMSPWTFEKIRNGPNGILRGLGKLIHKKTRSRNSCDTVPLRYSIVYRLRHLEFLALLILWFLNVKTPPCFCWSSSPTLPGSTDLNVHTDVQGCWCPGVLMPWCADI